MNVLNNSDGLDRNRYEERRAKLQGFCALEENWWTLLGRVTEMSGCFRYFNENDQADGYWLALWRMQPLVVLAEICGIDTMGMERQFLQFTGTKGQVDMVLALEEKMDGWRNDLQGSYWKSSLEGAQAACDGEFAADLRNELCHCRFKEGENLQAVFYRLLHTVSHIQATREIWFEKIKENSNMDPALAVMVVFLQNYTDIVARFNKRWEALPGFYYERVLEQRTLPTVVNRTWLVLSPGSGTGNVNVDAGTGFIAAGKGEETDRCYRTVCDVEITAMQLAKVFTVFPEQNEERFPAARLGFVTSLRRKEIPIAVQADFSPLFGGAGENVRLIFPGLTVESPMLLLREGERRVRLCFYLTPGSVDYFNGLTELVAWEGAAKDEVVYKVLKDTFYLKISTEDGWSESACRLRFSETEGCLILSFCLQEDFPPLIACREEQHGMESRMPVLQILTNPDAWLFSYSWARMVCFGRFAINVSVRGVRSVKVYNEAGGQDTTIPFYPFGVQAGRGAWMVFGNYEMALKPVVRAELCCKWRQLPGGENGFWGHYREYGGRIDNYSFKVRTEWLADKGWKTGEEQFLFSAVANNSRVDEESRILYFPDGNMTMVTSGEERYEYGKVAGGFMRMVLDGPDTGFGNTEYRQLFADTMVYNSRHKTPRSLPLDPIAPLLDELVLNYEAKDEYFPGTGKSNSGIRLGHVHPLALSGILPVKNNKSVAFAEGPEDEAILLFGFSQGEGFDRVSLFIDFDSERDENESRILPGCLPEADSIDVAWFLNTGEGWEAIDMAVRDTTGYFMKSGQIELRFSEPIPKKWLDKDGLFWISAAIRRKMAGSVAVRGFYTNAVEVVSEGTVAGSLPIGSITQPENNLPGIDSVRQILPGYGGRPAEDVSARDLRLAYGISHRNRAVTPVDYERLAMERFPELGKVKCLSVSEGDGKCLVRLVVMQPRSGGRLPGCSWSQLQEVHAVLCGSMPSFARLLVINPVYEEITVRCGVEYYEGVSVNETVRRLEKRLNDIISPWMSEGGMPVLGYVFSLQELRNAVAGDESVANLSGLSVLQVTSLENKIYELMEYTDEAGVEIFVKGSAHWCVAVPSGRHQIEWGKMQCWEEQVGVGGLEIGDTFIIK